jgi:protoporphyrinogen oxidase
VTRRVAFLIIGAGPTGLGAAHRLRELGCDDFLLLEANAVVGGLSRSFEDANGFTWDIGGHVCFSHDPYYNAVFETALAGAWTWHERRAFVHFAGRKIRYPFQLHLDDLGRAERDAALASLRAVRPHGDRAARNLEQWAESTFGTFIARRFFIPYNEKVWAFPARSLGFQWIGERVALPALDASVDRAPARGDWGPNKRFRVPLKGGTGSLWRKVAGAFAHRIVFDAAVVRIDPARHSLVTSSGETVTYGHLLSTMPLDRLAALSAPIPDRIAALAARLRHSAVHAVGLGLRGAIPAHLHATSWIYFPQRDIAFHRITLLSGYSRHNAPAGDHWSLLAEISESAHRPVDHARAVALVIAGLRKLALLADGVDVVSTWHHYEAYAYPTPTPDRDSLTAPLLAYFARRDIHSRGRFGMWRYETSNQDHCFMQGVELAEQLAGAESDPAR